MTEMRQCCSNAKTSIGIPINVLNGKKVLSMNRIYVHYGLKPLFGRKAADARKLQTWQQNRLCWASAGLLFKVQKLALHYSRLAT